MSLQRDGVIGWMVRNPVVPNLLMIFFIVGGLFTTSRIKKEYFPEFELDVVQVTVQYPGASPEEIERGIVTPIENAVRGIAGVDELVATAKEGVASVRLELVADADRQRTFQDIRQAVDRIRTLPENVERPQVNLLARRREVMRIALYGAASEASLRELAELVRDRLLESQHISQVEVASGRGYEVHVTLDEQQLRAYGLTHSQVAARIRAASVELPGGEIRTQGGDVLLRVSDRREYAREIRNIVLLSTDKGGIVRLSDVAIVREGFEEVDNYTHFNDHPSVDVLVFRVGDQTPIGVADTVRKVLEQTEQDLPDGITWEVLRDRSQRYRDRQNLLLKNACIGLILVMALLGLFLELRLAFWVTMGIPTSFLGAIVFFPAFDISINIISMFAFIVGLGIVVDDAIVAGENIFESRQRGTSFVQAAIRGAREVSVPISFAILTNIITFLPLVFVPGVIGQIWRVIPFVVIAAFLVSWVESLFILPAHLSREPRASHKRDFTEPARVAFRIGLQWIVRRVYTPALLASLRWKIVTICLCLALVVLTYGFVRSGRMGWILMPRVESDQAAVTAVLPDGTPQQRVDQVRKRLTEAIHSIQEDYPTLVTGLLAKTTGKKLEMFAYLAAPEVRPLSTAQVVRKWRERVGVLPTVQFVRFESDRGGPGSGAAVTVELSHRNIERLEQASDLLAKRLEEFSVVKDVDDGYARGPQQLNIKLSAGGASLGLTSTEIARQLRGSFYGAEALRYQRGRHEFKVLVRRPDIDRDSVEDVEMLLIQTPSGARVPLREVATVERGPSFTAITRRDAKRTVTVRANVVPIGDTSRVLAALQARLLPEIQRDIPGLSYSFRGRQRSFRESLSALMGGLLLATIVMYFVLAGVFRSYLKPLVVMIAIPLGAVGAVAGHWILGFNLSIISLMGFIALAGVLVNDALVLVAYADRLQVEGRSPMEAIVDAGRRRFRPVILTTLTTFGGLAPMIFETSRQARFMIPMAISLGFGILLATVVTLILVPCLYVSMSEIAGRWTRFFDGPRCQ